MAFYRLPAVKKRYGDPSSSGLYKAVAQGRFPRPVPLFPGSRAVVWSDGPDWAARKKQAAELLDWAGKTLLPPDERMQLEKQAADLLAPPAK